MKIRNERIRGRNLVNGDQQQISSQQVRICVGVTNSVTDNRGTAMLIRIITIMLLAAVTLSSAAEPLATSFTYQGELQVDGVPANGEYDFQFDLFAGPNGDENDLISEFPVEIDDAQVTDGVFSVELDFEDQFEDRQLWLAVMVRDGASTDDYTPLLPLQKITAAPYALHASRVARDTIGTFEIANDSVTSADLAAGAVGSSELAGGAVRTSDVNADEIQLRVSGDCMAGGAIQTVNQDGSVSCISNLGDYTDADAVAAMGTEADSNPLNHIKFSDADAVAALLAADGAGSTFDADLVDGLNASEIIDAANNAVRIPIDSVPFTIDQPGSYYFIDNLNHFDVANDAITITADNVTLDLMGFTLFGPGENSGNANSGIEMAVRTNVTVMNGTVRNFGFRGITELGSGRAHRMINVSAVNNGASGIFLFGAQHQVRGCTAQSNGAMGIFTDSGSLLIGNTAADNGTDGIVGSAGTTLTNNSAYDNQDDGIVGSHGATLTNNTAYNNQGRGVFGSTGSALTNNVAHNNQDAGIVGGGGGTLINNTAYENQAGIIGGFGTAMSNNTAYFNGSYGIYGFGSNLITGNTVVSNNTNVTSDRGGIRVGIDSRVVGNTLDSNSFSGIVVSGEDSIIDGNHVTDSDIGINFTSAGNAYRNNTAAGNTTAFGGLQLGFTTDLGGNASF